VPARRSRGWLVCRRVALILALLSSVFVCLLAAGCGLTIPADPEKTLERVTRSVSRRIHGGPSAAGPASRPGTEVDLVREFAGTLQAQVDWVVGASSR
jgi:polar amino acid transport system substrate-binding protein